MDQYRALLLEAEDQFINSWQGILQNYGYSIIRISLVLLARSVFILRDVVITWLNVSYMVILAPIDLFLCLVYVVAVNATTEYEQPENATGVDLNSIRRLFWQGKQIAISSDLKSLSIPNAILYEEDQLILQNESKEKKWSQKKPQRNEAPVINCTNPTDIDDSDAITLTQNQKQAVNHVNNHPSKPSLRSRIMEHRNLLYFLTRPVDNKSLDKHTRNLMSRTNKQTNKKNIIINNQ